MKTLSASHQPLKRNLQFALFSLVGLWHVHALSRTIIEADPKISFARATQVVDARIIEERKLSASSLPCGSTYTAIVLSSAKGSIPEGMRISFGFLGGLDQGITYNLYLLSDAPSSAWAGIMESRMAVDEDVDAWVKQCAPLHPTKTIFFRSNRIEGAK